MAHLPVDLFGLRFPTPILAGAGPQTDRAEGILAALAGGAGGIIARTISAVPGGAGITTETPATVPYGRDGLLTNCLVSSRSAADWLTQEYPQAKAAANRHGIPLIGSLTGPAAAVIRLGPALVAAGAQALEFSTQTLEWTEAVAAVRALRTAVTVPLIAKLSLIHGENIADRAAEIEADVDGFTCMAPFGPVLDIDVEAGGAPRLAGAYGWLGGGPIHSIAVRTVFEVSRRVSRPVIAAGGAMTARDVAEFLETGASLVQVCTGAVLHGPSIYGSLARELNDWLDSHGQPSALALRGLYLQRIGAGQQVVTTAERSAALAPDKCIRCSICGGVCYYDAIQASYHRLPDIQPSLCSECGLCVSACPTGALSLQPRADVTFGR